MFMLLKIISISLSSRHSYQNRRLIHIIQTLPWDAFSIHHSACENDVGFDNGATAKVAQSWVIKYGNCLFTWLVDVLFGIKNKNLEGAKI